MVLDPVFIFGLHMGITGAALATVISQGVTAFLIIRFLTGNQTGLRIHLERLDFRLICRILGLGISVFFMNVTNSLVQTVLYRQVFVYGNSHYVAALSIMLTLDQFIFLPLSGLGQGAQPMISYNFGAGNVVSDFYYGCTSDKNRCIRSAYFCNRKSSRRNSDGIAGNVSGNWIFEGCNV